jgi:hypothetical protein
MPMNSTLKTILHSFIFSFSKLAWFSFPWLKRIPSEISNAANEQRIILTSVKNCLGKGRNGHSDDSEK